MRVWAASRPRPVVARDASDLGHRRARGRARGAAFLFLLRIELRSKCVCVARLLIDYVCAPAIHAVFSSPACRGSTSCTSCGWGVHASPSFESLFESHSRPGGYTLRRLLDWLKPVSRCALAEPADTESVAAGHMAESVAAAR